MRWIDFYALHHASPSLKWNKPIYLSIKWNWKINFQFDFRFALFPTYFMLFFLSLANEKKSIFSSAVGSLFYFYCLVMSSHSYHIDCIYVCWCVYWLWLKCKRILWLCGVRIEWRALTFLYSYTFTLGLSQSHSTWYSLN